ncbi:MAG: hypothetical protein WKG07_24270 [Hymenobacter sp.]
MSGVLSVTKLLALRKDTATSQFRAAPIFQKPSRSPARAGQPDARGEPGGVLQRPADFAPHWAPRCWPSPWTPST